MTLGVGDAFTLMDPPAIHAVQEHPQTQNTKACCGFFSESIPFFLKKEVLWTTVFKAWNICRKTFSAKNHQLSSCGGGSGGREERDWARPIVYATETVLIITIIKNTI